MKLLYILCLFISTAVHSNTTMYPKTKFDMNKVTVKLMNTKETSGGSGVIYKSFKNYSIVLTNAHVCKIAVNGGIVQSSSGTYPIFAIKTHDHHDICEVLILANLQYNTKFAKNLFTYEKTITSGHPFLLPLTIKEGNYSSKMNIWITSYREECKIIKNKKECEFIAVSKNYMSYYFTNLIAPGNSGSPVFNEKGEIVSLIFAGLGRSISFGWGVPLDALKAIDVVKKKFILVKPKKLNNNNGFKYKKLKYKSKYTPAIQDSILDKLYGN